MAVKGFIFDLDGTLVDTLGDLTHSMNAALKQLGRPPRSAQQCRQMIGHGLRRFAQEALGVEHANLTDDLMGRMVAHYKDHCIEKTTAYPGMEKVIAVLARKRIRLAVLTNKNQTPAEIITRHFFGEAFDPIVGADDSRPTKPDPQSARDIISAWGLDKEDVWFAGDSETDIQTAANAGIRCLACRWGFRSKDQLLAAGAETFIRQPEQILEYLQIK